MCAVSRVSNCVYLFAERLRVIRNSSDGLGHFASLPSLLNGMAYERGFGVQTVTGALSPLILALV